MSLVQDMKKQIASNGGSKSKLFFVTGDTKRRIRFLQELDDGLELVFHDSFEKSVNVLCQTEIGKECPFCGDSEETGLRTRKLFAFLVYDYDSKAVKIMLYAANNFSPLPHFISFSEAYSTIKDRDYVIDRKGKQKNTVYTVIPQDKAKFRQQGLKMPSKKAILKLINKAHPFENDVDQDDYDTDAEDVAAYEDMTAKELYKECKKREIECETKKKKPYYIDLLEEDDLEPEEEDWDDDDDDNDDDDDDNGDW